MTQHGDDEAERAGERHSDAELVADHVGGSPTAFGVLVTRHQDRLWAVALRMVRDPDDAADVLQEALVKAFRRAETFRGQAAVSTWLHRIVVNTSLDWLRSSARAPVLALEPHEPPDRHDRVSERETTLDVDRALAALTVEQRAAVVVVDLQGFSVDEAAVILGCPPGTVKSRCFRARRRLASLLQAYDPGNQKGQPSVEQSGHSSRQDDPRKEEQE